MSLKLQEFVEDLKKEGITVSIKDTVNDEISEGFATKCSCDGRCGSCSGCKSRPTITEDYSEQEVKEKWDQETKLVA